MDSFDILLDEDHDEFTLLTCEMEAKADENSFDSRRHGGSAPGKFTNKKRDFDGTALKPGKYYSGVDGMPPVYDNTGFSRRFGIPRRVFDRLYSTPSVLPEFIRMDDIEGKNGIHPLQRIISTLRVLSYGYSYEAVDKVVEAPDTFMVNTVKTFCAAVLATMGDEYLREPSDGDLYRILAINALKKVYGFLGYSRMSALGMEDLPRRLGWKIKEEEKRPTVAMEAISDVEL